MSFNLTFAQGDADRKIVDKLNDEAWGLVGSDPEKASRLSEQALKQTENFVDYPAGKAFSLNTLGVLAQDNGDYGKAERLFNEALDIRLEMADSSLIASVYHNLASLKEMTSDCGVAFDFAIQAIRIWERTEEEEQLGKAYNTLGGIHECNENYDDAIEYTRKSLKLLRQFKNWEAIADAEYNLGRRFYLNIDETELEAFELTVLFDSAVVHYEQALELFETEVDDKAGHAWTLNALALIQKEYGSLENAETLYYEAIGKASEVGDSLGLSDINYNLSMLYESEGNFDKALEFLKASDQVLGNKGSEVDQQFLSEQYARIYSGLNDYETAYHYLENSDSLKTVFSQADMENELANKEAEYKSDLFKKESETQKLKAQKSRQTSVVFGIITALLLVILCLGAYLVLQRRKTLNVSHQQKIDDLLERQDRKFMDAYFEGQEEEKKKFADQLHTHLGSLLVAAKWDYDGLLEEMEHNGAQWASQLRLANDKLKNAYEEVRHQSHEFGVTRLQEIGLIAALEDLCQTISASGRIQTTFNSFGLNERLDTKIEIGIYRIVQELVANVLKHAKASNLNVQINPIENHLSILVEDDGVGFEYARGLTNGVGLSDIIARAENLDGSATFDTNKGAGTTVIVDIPLKMSSEQEVN